MVTNHHCFTSQDYDARIYNISNKKCQQSRHQFADSDNEKKRSFITHYISEKIIQYTALVQSQKVNGYKIHTLPHVLKGWCHSEIKNLGPRKSQSHSALEISILLFHYHQRCLFSNSVSQHQHDISHKCIGKMVLRTEPNWNSVIRTQRSTVIHTCSRSTSGASFMFLVCIRRISSRPVVSGIPMSTSRSKRPLRVNRIIIHLLLVQFSTPYEFIAVFSW